VSRIIEVSEPDLVTGDDGYVVFWPTMNKGCYTAHDLRAIADELDRRNKDWDEFIQSGYETSDTLTEG
jgi:hypothetical protein